MCANRVGDGARATLVDDEREQLVGRVVEERRRVVADEARVGRRDPRQRFEQDGQRRRSRTGRGAVELVAPGVDRADQPHGRLGALGVPAEPEQVLGGTRRQRVDRARPRTVRAPSEPELGDVCSGSEASTHMSFDSAPAWFETGPAGSLAPTRASPPGIADVRVSVRDANVRSTVRRGAMPVVGEHRRRAGVEPFLADPPVGSGRDAPSQLVELGGTRRERCRSSARASNARAGVTTSISEVGEDVRTTRRVAAPPRRDRVEDADRCRAGASPACA